MSLQNLTYADLQRMMQAHQAQNGTMRDDVTYFEGNPQVVGQVANNSWNNGLTGNEGVSYVYDPETDSFLAAQGDATSGIQRYRIGQDGIADLGFEHIDKNAKFKRNLATMAGLVGGTALAGWAAPYLAGSAGAAGGSLSELVAAQGLPAATGGMSLETAAGMLGAPGAASGVGAGTAGGASLSELIAAQGLPSAYGTGAAANTAPAWLANAAKTLGISPANLIKLGTSGISALLAANGERGKLPDGAVDRGYQGTIPKYSLTREYQSQPAGRKPGSGGGHRYFKDTYTKLAQGGIAALPPRMVVGKGDGMSDSVSANIDGQQPAALADGEFVVPADVVSHLGNGSSAAGARRLYQMMDRIRQARTGSAEQAPAVNVNKHLPA